MMNTIPSTFGMIALAGLLAVPVVAQQSQPAQGPNAVLQVDTVRLTQGVRASKLIGSHVYNDAGERIGTMDDLIVTGGDRIVVGVVSVGGFLGIGSKLVAVPYERLAFGQDGRITLQGATKESLAALPGFTYGG